MNKAKEKASCPQDGLDGGSAARISRLEEVRDEDIRKKINVAKKKMCYRRQRKRNFDGQIKRIEELASIR